MRQKLAMITERARNYIKSLTISVRRFRESKYKSGVHLALKKYKNEKGKLVAVKCNCAPNTWHPIINGMVMWTVKTTVHLVVPIKKKKQKRIFRPLNITV